MCKNILISGRRMYLDLYTNLSVFKKHQCMYASIAILAQEENGMSNKERMCGHECQDGAHVCMAH